MKRLDSQLSEQNSIKVPKVGRQRIRKRYYKTLETCIINSPIYPPYLPDRVATEMSSDQFLMSQENIQGLVIHEIRVKDVCLSLSMIIELFNCMSDFFVLVCLSVSLKASLSVCMSVYLSVCLTARKPVRLYVCLSVYMIVCLSIHLDNVLSVRVSVCTSVCCH